MSKEDVKAIQEFFPELDQNFPIKIDVNGNGSQIEISHHQPQDELYRVGVRSYPLQNNEGIYTTEITKPSGTAGRKPRAMRTKKNRLLTSVTLKKLKELVSIENNDPTVKPFAQQCNKESSAFKKMPKRVVRIGNRFRKNDKEDPYNYESYISNNPINEQEELRNELLKDEMIAMKCGREPAYRQSRYELAIFQTSTIKINPLFLMARCVDCHVDTHLEQRFFNFVLPYNPIGWLKCNVKDNVIPPKPTDKFNILNNFIFQIQIRVPFDYIAKIEPHPKHVVMKLKSCIDPSWIDLRNNSGGLLSGKLGEKLEMEKKINNTELKNHLEEIKLGLSNVDVFEFTFIKKNMVWFNHLIKVDFKFFKYLINEQGGDKTAIRRILKEVIEDNSPTRRVKKSCNKSRMEQSSKHYIPISIPMDYSKYSMTFKVTPLIKPMDGKCYLITSLDTGYSLPIAFPVLLAFIDQSKFENIPVNIILDESIQKFG
uniref:DUF659 domain-containing protein n=1 Tax=Strongyloides papillosus TaxID=174720 RepID=A0A0N5B2Q5_STREA